MAPEDKKTTSKYMPQTIAETARRIRAGVDGWIAIRDFFDDFHRADNETRAALIEEEPGLLDDPRLNAYLAATAEHFALHHQLPVPKWVHGPSRFLERFWFPTSIKSLHATALVQSPASFRRRMIFIDDTEFSRC